MDSPDRIPSGEKPVGIPEHLRPRLTDAAEHRLRQACDEAFPPDGRDAVIDAVHVIDALKDDNLSIEAVRGLVETAIGSDAPLAVPQTLDEVALCERQLAGVRELLEFEAALGGEAR
jgi:hypothetical protein